MGLDQKACYMTADESAYAGNEDCHSHRFISPGVVTSKPRFPRWSVSGFW
jgi:hypothetical protein